MDLPDIAAGMTALKAAFDTISVKSRPNGDPAWESSISLIVLANLPTGWGHGWTRKVTPKSDFT